MANELSTDVVWRRWVPLHPLVPVAVLFVCGVSLGWGSDWPVRVDLGVMTGAIGVWVVGEFWRRNAWVAQAGLAVAILFGGSGCWRLNQGCVEGTHVVRLLPDSKEAAEYSLRLRALGDGEVNAAAADLPTYMSRATQRVVVECVAAQTTAGWEVVSGTMTATLPSEPVVRAGEVFEAKGRLSRPMGPANPGEFDYRRMLAASRLFAHFSVSESQPIILVVQGRYASIGGMIGNFRHFMRGKLAEGVAGADEDVSNTLVALLFGYRAKGLEDISRAFTDAGVAHLLAISGFHVVLVAGLFWGILCVLMPRPRVRVWITVLLVVLYIAATPAGPPVLRAGIAMILYLLSRLLARPTFPANILSATVLVVLVLRPGDLLDPGFQLSFGVTAGLILLAERFQTFLGETYLDRQGAIARAVGTRWAGAQHRLTRLVLAGLATNAVASLIAVPLVAYHFHQFNSWATVSGVVLLPVVSVLIGAALLQTLAGMVWGPLGSMLGGAVAAITGWGLKGVSFFAGLPGAVVAVRPPPGLLIAAIYVVLLAWLLRHSLRLSRASIFVAAVCVMAMTAGWYTGTQRKGEVHIWPLAVGHGSAIVIEDAQGGHLLVNTGSLNRSGIGQRVVEPFLRNAGIGSLDAALATQLADDHTSNFFETTERYRPAFVGYSMREGREPITFAESRFVHRVGRERLRAEMLHAGDKLKLGGGAECEVLWPPEEAMPGLPAAQGGLILHVSSSGHGVLILGAAQGGPLGLMAEKLAPTEMAILTGGPPDVEMTGAMARAGIRRVYFPGVVGFASPEGSGIELRAFDCAFHIAIGSSGIRVDE